jgi:hypothetical protein
MTDYGIYIRTMKIRASRASERLLDSRRDYELELLNRGEESSIKARTSITKEDAKAKSKIKMDNQIR